MLERKFSLPLSVIRVKFLVDESLGKRFSDVLNREGYASLFVGDLMRSAPDEDVLASAENEDLILMTDDKDFGELVFRQKKSTKGAILFRVRTTDPEKLLGMAKSELGKAKGKFIVIEVGQIRVRELK